jgi:hypothetical protein
MPPAVRKVQPPSRVDVSTRLDRLKQVAVARREFLDQKLPARIKQTPVKTAMIAYLLRILSERSKRSPLTPIQKRIVGPVVRAGLDVRIVKRFGLLPEAARAAIEDGWSRLARPSQS